MHTYIRPPVASHLSDTACQWTPICNCTCWQTGVHVCPFKHSTPTHRWIMLWMCWRPMPDIHSQDGYSGHLDTMYTNVITLQSELHLVILSHGDEIADPAAGNLWVTCIQISQCQCLAQMSMSVVNCAEITNNKKTSQFPVTEVQRQLLLPTFDSLREIFWDYEQSVSNSSGTTLPDSVHV